MEQVKRLKRAYTQSQGYDPKPIITYLIPLHKSVRFLLFFVIAKLVLALLFSRKEQWYWTAAVPFVV